MLRVLLADDHHVIREGIRALLEREGLCVVAEAGSGPEAVRLAQSGAVDVVVIDVGMPGLNGLDAARAIAGRSPHPALVLLTMHTEDAYVFEALKVGVKAYVHKSQSGDELIQGIRAAVAGQLYLSPGLSENVIEAAVTGNGRPPGPLTWREQQ